MLTDFQRRKLNRMFEMYDVDKNGFVEQADYEQIARNLSTIYRLAPNSPEHAGVHAHQMGFWQGIRGLSTAPDRCRVTRDEFLKGYESLLGKKEQFLAQMGGFADAVISVSDRNHDGVLSLKEYADNLRGFDMGLSEEDALETARRLDGDGDGKLTRQDIMSLLEEFFYSDDPKAAGNSLLGKY